LKYLKNFRGSDYSVTRDGDVISFTRYSEGRTLKPKISNNGYVHVTMYRNGRRNTFLLHRVVWITFNGEIPEGMTIDHINGIKTDNRLLNLRLGTQKENNNWAYEQGLSTHYGESNHMTKLKLKDVVIIKQSNGPYLTIANKFNVSKSTVADIKKGRSWVRALKEMK